MYTRVHFGDVPFHSSVTQGHTPTGSCWIVVVAAARQLRTDIQYYKFKIFFCLEHYAIQEVDAW